MFSPNQIVCLECNQTRLYGEVIQVLESRQMCWVRPILLVDDAGDTLADWNQSQTSIPSAIHPITDGPDLLWPTEQFCPAVDTDVIPLMAVVQTIKSCEVGGPSTVNQRLRLFMEQLWLRQAGGENRDHDRS